METATPNLQLVQLVQNLVERCLQLCMTQQEVVLVLQQHAKIEPEFTSLVWEKLEEQNKEFFVAYYTRLRLKDQVLAFNALLEQQATLSSRWMSSTGLGGRGGVGGGPHHASLAAPVLSPGPFGAFDSFFGASGGAALPVGELDTPLLAHHHQAGGVGVPAPAHTPASFAQPSLLHAHGPPHAGGAQHHQPPGMPRSFSLSDLGELGHDHLGGVFHHHQEGPELQAGLMRAMAADAEAAAASGLHAGGMTPAGRAAGYEAGARPGMGAHGAAVVGGDAGLARLPHTFSLSDIALAMFAPPPRDAAT